MKTANRSQEATVHDKTIAVDYSSGLEAWLSKGLRIWRLESLHRISLPLHSRDGEGTGVAVDNALKICEARSPGASCGTRCPTFAKVVSEAKRRPEVGSVNARWTLRGMKSDTSPRMIWTGVIWQTLLSASTGLMTPSSSRYMATSCCGVQSKENPFSSGFQCRA